MTHGKFINQGIASAYLNSDICRLSGVMTCKVSQFRSAMRPRLDLPYRVSEQRISNYRILVVCRQTARQQTTLEYYMSKAIPTEDHTCCSSRPWVAEMAPLMICSAARNSMTPWISKDAQKDAQSRNVTRLPCYTIQTCRWKQHADEHRLQVVTRE